MKFLTPSFHRFLELSASKKRAYFASFFKKKETLKLFYSPLRLLKIIAAIKSIEHGGDF